MLRGRRCLQNYTQNQDSEKSFRWICVQIGSKENLLYANARLTAHKAPNCVQICKTFPAQTLRGRRPSAIILRCNYTHLRDEGCDVFYSNNPRVPATINMRPHNSFRACFSWKTTRAKKIVTRMLSLSIGATMLAGPSCNAL